MSKSYNNTINIIESPDNVKIKIRKMFSDPKRLRIKDIGKPENCSIWTYHNLYTSKNEKSFIYNSCTTAKIGCFDCKKILSYNINQHHYPIRKKYNMLKKNKSYILNIIEKGSYKARKIASKNLKDIKEAIGLMI